MKEGTVQTHAFAKDGKVRLTVIDGDNAIEMEGDILMARHLIESIEIAIKEAQEEK